MKRSFYHYLMTLRGPNAADEIQVFANNAEKDIQFPKQSDSYEEISDYLEMNVDYLSNMDVFDRVWQKYLENNR